jgi:hypothetical protein
MLLTMLKGSTPMPSTPPNNAAAKRSMELMMEAYEVGRKSKTGITQAERAERLKENKVQNNKQISRRLDGDVNSSASWRLQRLAEVWGCSIAAVVERLAVESDEKYAGVLFPETK